MTVVTFNFDWSNFSLGLVVWLTIESLAQGTYKKNSLSVALFIATITPIMSLIMRNGIINPDVPVNGALILLDCIVYICMLSSILYVYQFRLRIFDSTSVGGVRFNTFDWCVFGSQTFFCTLDIIVIYHFPRTDILPSWVGTKYNAIIYIIEVLHELLVDILLLLALWRNVRNNPKMTKMDNAYMWDMIHLAVTVVLTMTIDIAVIFMNYYLDPSYFLSTKRLGYAIKVRLALEMFRAIKDHRTESNRSRSLETTSMAGKVAPAGTSSDRHQYDDEVGVGLAAGRGIPLAPMGGGGGAYQAEDVSMGRDISDLEISHHGAHEHVDRRPSRARQL